VKAFWKKSPGYRALNKLRPKKRKGMIAGSPSPPPHPEFSSWRFEPESPRDHDARFDVEAFVGNRPWRHDE
jgi:hypothetical protein